MPTFHRYAILGGLVCLAVVGCGGAARERARSATARAAPRPRCTGSVDWSGPLGPDSERADLAELLRDDALPGPDGLLIRVEGTRLRLLDSSSGRARTTLDDALGGDVCEGLLGGREPLLFCHGSAEDHRVVRLRRLDVERGQTTVDKTFRGMRYFEDLLRVTTASSIGSLLVRSSCDGTFRDNVACVRDPQGGWTERPLAPSLLTRLQAPHARSAWYLSARGRLVVLVFSDAGDPPPRNRFWLVDGYSGAAVEYDARRLPAMAIWAVLDGAQSAELSESGRLRVVATIWRERGAADRVGWIVEVGLDGTARAERIEGRTGVAGPRVLRVAAAGATWESADFGRSWTAAAPLGVVQATQLTCAPGGCWVDDRGRTWVRPGWACARNTP